MENTVLKLLQCLSDINSNNCLVSVYAGGQTGIQSNKYTKYHSLQGQAVQKHSRCCFFFYSKHWLGSFKNSQKIINKIFNNDLKIVSLFWSSSTLPALSNYRNYFFLFFGSFYWLNCWGGFPLIHPGVIMKDFSWGWGYYLVCYLSESQGGSN